MPKTPIKRRIIKLIPQKLLHKTKKVKRKDIKIDNVCKKLF